jgi:hypothetical protein
MLFLNMVCLTVAVAFIIHLLSQTSQPSAHFVMISDVTFGKDFFLPAVKQFFSFNVKSEIKQNKKERARIRRLLQTRTGRGYPRTL